MTLTAGMSVRAATGLDPAAHEEQGWSALQHLVLARLLVAALALPFGILLRPEITASPVHLLVNALGAVVLMTVLFGGLTKVRRGLQAQTALQLVADLAFVSALAAHTGGRDSQFVLFYALVVITGGVLGRLTGGLLAAGGACAGFLALPALAHLFGANPAAAQQPRPEMLVAFLTIVGVLSGVLGDRVARTRGDLERTARELDRVRIDNDVVLRHLATGVFTVDASGVVGYLNPAAEQVLGLRVMETRGRHVSVALPERLAALRDIVIETQQSRRGRARAELLMRTASGRALPVGISTNVLMHQDEMTGVVAVFQDLTEVRDMERRARRNETLAEVGALAAGIAHELRNGLKPIAGSVEYLQRELQLEGEEAQLVDLIARESSRLNKFVTDLLSYSRERDLALVPVDLDDQLRDVVNTLAHDPRRGSNVHVTLEGGPGAAWVPMDPEQMHQVWLNLASNAMEAVGERGTFTIRWSAQADGGVVVDFVDSGPGIAAEDLPRVGEPFFTTKRGGTGLGLAIAQRIVERHGGVLTLESEAGRGTTARVTLPGAAAPVAQAA
ncbi:MAG: PAS domain S-box protein [Candidatus Eisenbacteria bacterium]|uniref:histidine kinase n=1 Tax=Eiseniibacteriota bacterium TaxID=2212470 RepID=A0A933SEG4_UNCEI|nr:PAS domain S-box protein [Candidatus Eisenbacteria bacterium]